MSAVARIAALALGWALCGCGSAPEPRAAEPPVALPEVLALRARIAELAARPEVADERILIEHALVRAPAAGTPEFGAAELQAARLFAALEAGAELQAALRAHADTTAQLGVHGMTAGEPTGGYIPRALFVPAFGDAAWRLAPGELGAVAPDPVRSPYGWHLLRRLE